MASTYHYNATISRREELHAHLMLLSVVPDDGPFAPFLPGQFVSIGRIAGRGACLIKRSYSIGSSALERGEVELFLVHVDDGEFTSWLFEQRVGARVWLSPRASGGFTLDGFAAGRDLVMVSTGTAVAPYVSMVRTFGGNPPWRRAVLFNGVRYAADLGYCAELESFAAMDERFRYLPMVTREPADSAWRGARGRVSDMLVPGRFAEAAGFSLDPEQCHVFLCGNPLMIEELEASLHGLGFRKHTPGHPGNLHLEKYWTE
ncbi:MAG: ferredoxin--NADP reductase [Candidatus Krumholzibacteria bacterium]|nr:ferredoxin--NADP reductase [Candidatus Krumholzibacteria bacterium]MDH4338600.1 ferredoxin--NADP reductase [Candidatus Krumholzibacteria bacterium]MDH5271253.1 ferredoxin--NADP reductase [Candidatus Krumholzibacteria bacterium]